MMSYVLEIIIGFLLLAALFRHALAGFRHGDRDGDALVGAMLRSAGATGRAAWWAGSACARRGPMTRIVRWRACSSSNGSNVW